MILITDKGERIKTSKDDAQLTYSDVHGLWYATGYRWIKSRQAWSKTCLRHSFESFTRETEQ